MATKQEKNNKTTAENLQNKSSLLTYGMDNTLDTENETLKNIVQQTISETKNKLGIRTNGKPINYFNELNFGNAFSELFVNKDKSNSDNDVKTANDFKQYMENNGQVDAGSLLAEDGSRTILYNNYRIINQHIPECSMALKIYKDNIMSPDDFTKLIFNIKYDSNIDADVKNIVESRLDDISEKYQLEDKADKIIEETLMLGDSYCAVLSIENELQAMLNDPLLKGSILNESAVRLLDKNVVSNTLLSENVKLSESECSAFNECLGIINTLSESKTEELFTRFVNENVIIGSPCELLLEKADAENDKYLNDIPEEFYNSKKSSKKGSKKSDNKPMYLNGSTIRRLEPDRVIDLTIDDTCYGYYYAEEVGNNIPQQSYLGMSSGRNANGTMAMAQNNTISNVGGTSYTPNSSAAGQLGVGEKKLSIISNLFVNAISKKIDKDFIRNNKKFKDFIYNLVRQDYIIKKGLKLTYFKPDEVIHFQCDPIFKDITFFAKLYLSILTNNLLIKLGRSHDKRVFYINTGVDAAYEQAVNSVIQDVKTKDYKMEQLNDFNTLLNLNPGRFDDYFMPTVNGDRPVEIETLPGMDIDMNNEFVEYLKNSMMSGMGVPRNLIDVTSDVDYARSISAMNSNFVRSVIRYQKKFTPSFTRLYQKIYKNEYKFTNNDNANETIVDINAIKVTFPSPATLAMSNISDQIQSADSNAEFISSQIFPIKSDGSTEDQRLELKTMIVKDLLPSVDWNKYEEYKEVILRNKTKTELESKANPLDPNMNPNAGYEY